MLKFSLPTTIRLDPKYPILNEIMPWSIDDLTFYFKNDTLRLIFSNGAHGNSNQILDIPLTKLQQYLNL